LLPNNRIPGFIFHQPERQFDNNTGTDPGNMQVWTRWHVRDFDHPGWKYSMWSTVGTAACNLITANIPARDQQENQHFSAADVHWWRRTYDWVDEHLRYLNKTQPIPGYGAPSVSAVDGTAAMNGDEGFLFLFNAGPLPRMARLHVDEMLGLSNSSHSWSWIVSELYPNEPPEHGRSPVAVWQHGAKVDVEVGGAQVRVLQLSRVVDGHVRSSLPAFAGATDVAWAFNLSYLQAVMAQGVLNISRATALSGTTVRTTLAVHEEPRSIVINGKVIATTTPFAACAIAGLKGLLCAEAVLHFGGTAISWSQQVTDTTPPADFGGGWFNSTFTIPSAMLLQLERSQAAYPIQWTDADLDATWLAPNRLLLYPYVVHPLASMAPIEAWVDEEPLAMLPAYNSRGNRKSKNCFLGWYANVSGAGIAPDVQHHLALRIDLSALPRPTGSFLGVFWQNLVNEYSSTIVGWSEAGVIV